MESFEIPETPTSREAAKGEQLEAVERLRSLLTDFERFDYWPNCFKQLAEAVRAFQSATVGVELAELAEEGEE